MATNKSTVMTCREIEPLLLSERDGVLTEEQHAALEAHEVHCPACRQMRTALAEAMAGYKVDAGKVVVPNVDAEWRTLQASLKDRSTQGLDQSSIGRVIWFAAPLAAAAALAFAYFRPSQQQGTATDPISSNPEVAQANYVEAGDASASTLVYVDKESGWLVVWATDNDPTKRG